jgi:DNA sulfur modification protein DndC
MTDPERFILSNKDRVALVINLSGGKDSTRMLGYLRDRFPKIPAYCVMADTGFEHVRPIPAVDWTRTLCSRFGVESTVVRPPNKTYLEMVRRLGDPEHQCWPRVVAT